MIGSSAMGRGSDKILLNAANGNLVVDRSDEVLIGRGPDAEVSLTYNSQGDPAFAWSLGAYRVLYGLTGTANTSGSTIRRTDRDTHVRVYSYDAQRNAYVNSEGTGAQDVVRYVNGTWSWSDSDSGITETYTSLAASPSYLYVSTVSDRDGNTQTYSYDSSAALSRITNANGDYTV
ncbi:MAG TPA: hypothetical protein VEA60_13115, partial [Allosphingosinicella sp.]|nr:hypothetical protein [Allosphingosinicella sp.]